MRFPLNSLIHGYRRFGQFSNEELKKIGITSLVFGFILSFRKWGVDSYDPAMGLRFFFAYAILSYCTILAIQIGTRFWATKQGYIPTYDYFPLGLALGVLITFLSNGFVPFLVMGGTIYKRHEGLRLGIFRHGIRSDELSKTVIWGFASLIAFAIFLKLFVHIAPTGIAEAIRIVYIIAIFSLIPIDIPYRLAKYKAPNSNGTILFLGDRGLAAFGIVLLFSSYFLITFTSGIKILAISAILGLASYVIWTLYLDRNKLL